MKVEKLSKEVLAATKGEGMGVMGSRISFLFNAPAINAGNEEEYLRSCLRMAQNLRTLPTAEPLRTSKVQENFIQMNMAMALMEERINKLPYLPVEERK